MGVKNLVTFPGALSMLILNLNKRGVLIVASPMPVSFFVEMFTSYLKVCKHVKAMKFRGLH